MTNLTPLETKAIEDAENILKAALHNDEVSKEDFLLIADNLVNVHKLILAAHYPVEKKNLIRRIFNK